MKTQSFTHSLTLITLSFYVYFTFSYAWPRHHRHKHGYKNVDTPEKLPKINFGCIDLPSNSSVSDIDPASHANLNPTVQVLDAQILKPTAEMVHATSLPNFKLPAQAMQLLQPGPHSHLHLHVNKQKLRKRDNDILTRTLEVTVQILPTEGTQSLQAVKTTLPTASALLASALKASVSTSATFSICPASNGSMYTSNDGSQYQIICNTNVVGSDLPFQLANTFDECIAKCDSLNTNAGSQHCVAAVFVPSRENDSDDCYLKYSTEKREESAELIEAAFLQNVAKLILPKPTNSTQMQVASKETPISQTMKASQPIQMTSSAPGPAVTYAKSKNVIVPEVAMSYLHGPTRNHPTNQFIEWKSPPDLRLTKDLLKVGIEGDLSIDYGISLDTGILELNSSTQNSLKNLTDTPHLSRDGGKGGYLNGQNLFLFCDTGSYSTTTGTTNGNFLGFVSSSCATDVGMNGLQGEALYLEDGIGVWSDNVGRMRGFAPMTRGEQSYNLAMQGNGQRYAIWPEASITVIDSQTALLYAPIVYDNVNMKTKSTVFTYTGATLLSVTAGGRGGPVAERIVDKLFNQDEVEWGCSGGIRSWGSSGVGGKDGRVYIFGTVAGGLLLARTGYGNVTDRNSYEYWTGSEWNSGMQPPSSKAFFLNGPILDVDVFYSPRHLTFIVVYLTIYADSTFYYRYLKADHAILPPYVPREDPNNDYVENMVKYDWSEEQVLYKAKPGLSGRYIYSGGVHQGYYGSDDITNGGSKMLISWTAPTGLDPATEQSEYQIVTAEIDWA